MESQQAADFLKVMLISSPLDVEFSKKKSWPVSFDLCPEASTDKPRIFEPTRLFVTSQKKTCLLGSFLHFTEPDINWIKVRLILIVNIQ